MDCNCKSAYKCVADVNLGLVNTGSYLPSMFSLTQEWEWNENGWFFFTVTTIPPGSSESTEEDVVTVSVTEATTTTGMWFTGFKDFQNFDLFSTENPVEVEPKIQAGQIHPSSAQLQVNETGRYIIFK